VGAIFCQLIGPIVSANDRGNMGYGLIMLVRSPAKIASCQRGFDQIDWVRELAIKVQEYRPGMGLQRPHHLHRISWSVVQGVEDARQGTAGRVVGVGAIAGSGNALEFGDEVAGTAVDGLASERAGQTSIRRVDQGNGRIARWQRLIYAGHMGGEKLRESSVQEQPFADGVFRRRGFHFGRKIRRIARAAAQQERDCR
jgi:hypothetical protein